MSGGRSISVVIVAFDDLVGLLRCLDGLAACRDRFDLEIVVVANRPEGFSEHAEAGSELVDRVIEPGRNIGYAAACNLGAAESSGELVLLLNPDAVVNQSAMAAAVELLDRRDGRAIVGARTVDESGRENPWFAGSFPGVWTAPAMALGLAGPRGGRPEVAPGELGVDFVAGCFLLTSRSVWGELGGFDERFFVYWEDTDMARRAEAVGIERLVVAGEPIEHRGGWIPRGDRLRERCYAESFGRYARKHGSVMGMLWVRLWMRAWLVRRRLGYAAPGRAAG